MIGALAWSCAVVGLCGLVVELANLRHFPLLRKTRAQRAHVAACVAMRDEEQNARACIEGLLQQPEIGAIVVCDDGSEDGTRAVLVELALREPRLRIVTRSGAGSKAAALALAANAAMTLPHSHLLFTDADVRLEPGCVAALLAYAERESADAVSAWPRVHTRSLADALLSPLVTALLLQVLPMQRLRAGDERCAAGNGQLFLVRSRAYARCGGHARNRAIVEDVALARALVRNGSRLALASAARIAWVSGYGSLRANVAGLGRSLFAGAGVPGCVAFALWQWWTLVLPLALLRVSPAAASSALAAAVLARIVLAARMRSGISSAFLAPAGAIVAGFGALLTAVAGSRNAISWRRTALRQ